LFAGGPGGKAADIRAAGEDGDPVTSGAPLTVVSGFDLDRRGILDRLDLVQAFVEGVGDVRHLLGKEPVDIDGCRQLGDPALHVFQKALQLVAAFSKPFSS
jgi:hypothetical protein